MFFEKMLQSFLVSEEAELMIVSVFLLIRVN